MEDYSNNWAVHACQRGEESNQLRKILLVGFFLQNIHRQTELSWRGTNSGHDFTPPHLDTKGINVGFWGDHVAWAVTYSRISGLWLQRLIQVTSERRGCAYFSLVPSSVSWLSSDIGQTVPKMVVENLTWRSSCPLQAISGNPNKAMADFYLIIPTLSLFSCWNSNSFLFLCKAAWNNWATDQFSKGINIFWCRKFRTLR